MIDSGPSLNDSVKLRPASVRDVRPLVRRAVRRTARKHQGEAGIIAVGQFPLLMTLYNRRSISSLRLCVGRRRHTRHVTWLMRETTREAISWRKKPIKLALPIIFPRALGPKWVPLDAGESYILRVMSYDGATIEAPTRRDLEITPAAGEKRMLFWDGTDRGSPPTFSLRRL